MIIQTYGAITLKSEAEKFAYTFCFDKSEKSFTGIPSMVLPGGKKVSFEGAKCTVSEIITGTSRGVSARFEKFAFPSDIPAEFADLAAVYDVEIMSDGLVRTSVRFENEPQSNGVQKVTLQAVAFGAEKGEGYTVLPRMQGVIIPAKYEIDLHYADFQGLMFERAAYMPVFGQVTNCRNYGKGAGYTAIYKTPYDGQYEFDHKSDGDSLIYPVFVEQLGRMAYKRVMLYKFEEDADYTKIAKNYRQYLKENGLFVSLNEKAAKNPGVEYLYGAPVIHTNIAIHISEQSAFYDPNDPAHNDNYTSFGTRAEQLRKLKENGLEKAYIHLDGWGAHGYDNLHPSPFPPHKDAGGAEGMAKLSDTCAELGYKFGIHDQYRDYYYDSENFSLDNAIVRADGSTPYCSVWNGGAHSFLCASLAPEYVKRNYDKFEQLGIRIDGSYLDVFAVVELDECFSKDHPMTREECVKYRRQCFEILSSKGIIPSSEEPCDSMLPSIALCHHAPYNVADYDHRSHLDGIPIPFFNLVWHDGIVTPWFALSDGWGIPDKYQCLGLCYINGGTTYVRAEGMTAQEKEKIDAILALHGKIANYELLRHEIIDGDPLRQRSVFDSADGEITVEVDFTDADNAKVKVK